MKPHRARILAMQASFQKDFQAELEVAELLKFEWIDYDVSKEETAYVEAILLGITDNKAIIDQIIDKYSDNWEFDRISLINKAILRVAVFQLKFQTDIVPGKVVIDEAVRLAHEYAEDDAPRFINGLLDAYFKKSKS